MILTLLISLLAFLLSLLKTAAYENYPANRLTKGSATAQSLVTTAVYDLPGPNGNNIVPTAGDSTLVVQADLNGAASGDLTVTVTPYEADNVTISGVDLPVIQSVGPTFAGGKVTYYGQYDVTGVDSVRIRAKNNNAGTQTLNRLSFTLS